MHADPANPATALRVVIVGGGTAGWMCAAALAGLLVQRDYHVTLIESDEIGTIGVGEATLPHLKTFNDMLGIVEADFMRETGATFKLGVEFVGWGDPGGRYIHPFGTFGEPWDGVEFQHHWVRARAAGHDVAPLQAYSYAVAAARKGAFEHPHETRRSIRSSYSYAYHLDAGRYADYLRRWAIARGVRRLEGRVVDVNSTSNINSLTLQSGEVVSGDLFIDCSGFRALLIGGAMGVEWQDWSDWLPCDRAMALPSSHSNPLIPYTSITAQPAGWTWRIPLQQRTGNGYVFASRFCDEDTARDTLIRAITTVSPIGEPRLLRFAPGRRSLFWRDNCVAIGLSAGFLEPLESTGIYLIQAAVTDLIRLMPTPGRYPIDQRLASEFNRLMAMQYDRVRDFLILHYTANARIGEPFWDHLRHMPVPDSLTETIALFESGAALPDYRYGLFSRDSWLALLVGQGKVSRDYNRLADRLPLPELADRMRDLVARIDTSVAAMTAHGDFVASYCAVPSHTEAAA